MVLVLGLQISAVPRSLRNASPLLRQYRSLPTSSVWAEPRTNICRQKNEYTSSISSRSAHIDFPKKPIGDGYNGHMNFFSYASNVSSLNRKFSSSRADAEELVNKEDHAHCVDLVQTRDYEGYLCGLLLPQQARPYYFALRAFNIEIASIKDGGGIPRHNMHEHSHNKEGSGNTSIASRLRMQWWRDAITYLYSASPNDSAAVSDSLGSSSFQYNPIIRSLGATIRSKGLTRRFLERMIDAREADLDILQYPTMDDLVRYSEQTMCSLMYLSLEICDVLNEEADTIASHVGVGIGLVMVIRSIRIRAEVGGGEIGIPQDLVEKYNVPLRYLEDPPASAAGILNSDNDNDSDEEIGRDREAREAIQNAVKEMAYVARAHLHHARNEQGKVPNEGKLCLLPAVLALEYLDRLEKFGFNIFHTDLNMNESLDARISNLKRSALLVRAWLTGVF